MSDTHADAHDAHAGDHDAHAPEPKEFTHPALWTVGLVAIAAFLVWLFFHELGVGRTVSRGEIPVPLLVKAEGGGEPEPDHLKLIADRSPEVLEKGQSIFGKNCASCHGMNGDLKGGTAPNARNFHADAFKNPCGGGPYGLYLVVTNGWGAMPSMKASLNPEQRYAVIHYIRETWVKTDNAKNYLVDDLPEEKAKIPAPGAKGEEGPSVPPNEVTAPEKVFPLMRAIADEAETQVRSQQAWLDAAAGAAAPEARADVERLRALAARDRALGAMLQGACKAGDRKLFVALLVEGQSPGAPTADFALMSADRLAALYASARAAAEGSR
jgi:cytochrome c5